MRWKTEVNENANAPAFWNTHPELCHNEMQGWGQHGDVTRQVLTLVNVRHEFEHPQVMRRFDVTQPLLDEVVAGVHEVWAAGEGQLAQLLDLMVYGTFVSLELAAQEGIDPGPMDTLDQIKQAVSLP
jgi:glucose/mannose-6-phosphate isomerase